MTDPVPTAPPQAHSLRQALRSIGWLDWSMLLLALLSVGLLGYETWGPVSAADRWWIIRGDYLICAIFAAEFLWRWRQAGWRWRYLVHNWYDILGMIPIAHPALRGFRLFRVLRIVILLARFGMAADRALGAEFTYRLVDRFSASIVDAISGPITIAVLEEVADVLQKGTYTRNIARALDENHRELRAMIADKLRADPRTGRLKRLPFYDDIVASVVDAGLDVVQEVLRDPRTDELVADMLRENITQLREAVARNQV
jgi:voltage-gated potassium channel